MTSTTRITSPIDMSLQAVSATRPKRIVNWPKLSFIGLVLIAFAFYTEMAMGMEWRTVAGRIGPGFFPRILGFTAMGVAIVALVREYLARPTQEPVGGVEAAEEAAEPDLGRHPVALVAFIAAAAVFVALFGVLGAALSGVLFLAVTLWFLDREHHLRAAIIAVTIPVLLYLAFETGLNVGLPQGILPIG